MEKLKHNSKESSLKQDKSTKSETVSKTPVRFYRATAGHILPLSYKGSIIHIGTSEAVEIDVEALAYEPRIQFERALADKQIVVEGTLQ